ncbi:MAG: phosphodiesterase [Pseudomonadota bacterium]
MLIVHLTDLHLVTPGRCLFGLDPLAQLELALDHLAARFADADVVLVTGDLTDVGHPVAYAALRERLQHVPPPTALLIGNHDEREAFVEVFPEAPRDPAGFIQRVVDHDDGTSLVTLDTHVPGAAHGQLCETRLAWLADVLAMRPERAVALAMHHPPVDCGIPGMDAIGLVDPLSFWRVVDASPQVRHVFAGHIHRTYLGRRGTVSVSTLPGTSHQVHLQFGAEGAVLGSHEPGAYAVAKFTPTTLDLHHIAFADRSPRFVFDDAASAAQSPDVLPPPGAPWDRFL